MFGCDVACDIVYAGSSLAPRHFAVAKLESSHVICDLGSGDGVDVNGQRVAGRRPIVNNDVIKIGDMSFVYRGAEFDVADTVAIPIISAEMIPRLDFSRFRLPGRSHKADPQPPKSRESDKPKPLPIRTKPLGSPGKLPTESGEKIPPPQTSIPQKPPTGRMRKRHADAGTRTAGRRELLAKGKSTKPEKSLKADSDSDHSHREHRHLIRRQAAKKRQQETQKLREQVARRSPTTDADIGNALNQAVAWERGASQAQIVDAVCTHCNFQFCHVNEGFADPDLEYDIECQRCLKKIVIQPEDQLEVVEKRWSKHVWAIIISGLDFTSLVGLICVVISMVHFTMLAGKGFSKFGKVAGSTFLVFENTTNYDTPTLISSGVAMLIFGMAPFVILAATRVIAEDFTMPLIGSVFCGCLFSPLIWKSVAGVPFSKIVFVVYGITGLGVLFGMIKLCDTKETELTKPLGIGIAAMLISVGTLFVTCFVEMDQTGASEIIGSGNLAIWTMAAGMTWVIAEVCQLQYMRGISEFLRQSTLTKAIEECSVFLIVLAGAAFCALLLLALGAAKGTAADISWLLVGFAAVINVVWFFQVTRFTRYSIR